MSRFRKTLLPMDLSRLTKQELIDRLELAEDLFYHFQRDRLKDARRHWRMRKQADFWRGVVSEEMKEAKVWFTAREFIRSNKEKLPSAYDRAAVLEQKAV